MVSVLTFQDLEVACKTNFLRHTLISVNFYKYYNERPCNYNVTAIELAIIQKQKQTITRVEINYYK